MKKLVVILACVVWFLGSWTIGFAQTETINKFAQSLQNGDTKDLLDNLGNQVEMNIEGNRQTVNKSKSESLIKEFITKHRLTKFEFLHKGSSGTAGYAIGKYTAEDGNYRVVVKLSGQLIEKIDFTKE
jgi:spore cortex formation protein SpoVR/YcgB (stage V sporulation)